MGLTLQPLPHVDPTRALKAALKRLLRHHGLRCLSVREESSPQKPTEYPMDKSELECLRRYASVARSRGGFGALFLKCDGNTGEWKAGKDGNDMAGRQLVADVPDAMQGFQKFENRKPIYVIGRICDGYVPPERSTLGDTDKTRWHRGKDPWESVVLLPMYDPESREPFIFTSSNGGGKDAVTALVDAVVDNAALHPDDADKLPLCQLSGDHYENSHGKTIYTPIFEIMDWTPFAGSGRRRSTCWRSSTSASRRNPRLRLLRRTGTLPLVAVASSTTKSPSRRTGDRHAQSHNRRRASVRQIARSYCRQGGGYHRCYARRSGASFAPQPTRSGLVVVAHRRAHRR
jgi:hypothetical protein